MEMLETEYDIHYLTKCPGVSNFNLEKDRAEYDTVNELIWWYTCTGIYPPNPTNFLNDNTLSYGFYHGANCLWFKTVI
jgi:hypothetical protein